MTLPAHMYRDPLDILIAAESHSCKGCKHAIDWTTFGPNLYGCEKSNPRYSTKCYEETAGKVYRQGGK